MNSNSEFPLISVIVPTYNSHDTIINCIKSILAQTYKKIEIIVIDDGSTDKTVELLYKFNNYQKNKIHILKQENKGPSVARNVGINYAHGEYIAFLDSDDEWYPQKIEKQILILQKNKEVVMIGCLYSIGDKQIFQNKPPRIQKISLKKLLLKNQFITSTVICKQDILHKYNFNEKQKYSEDYNLWIKIAHSGETCLLLNEVLTKMNNKPLWGYKGLSSKLWLMEKGELSNYMYAYKNSYISFSYLLFISSFSLIKYFKRILISKAKNIFMKIKNK